MPDAFNHLFSTNDPHPPDNTLLASLRSSLDVMHSFSNKIQKYIAVLQKSQAACALLIHQHEVTIRWHPIRSLPDDILLNIFGWHHTEIDVPQKNPERLHFQVRRSPWTLSQVSQRWRALTLSSPLLWSTIIVQDRPVYGKHTLSHRWDLVIERSRNCDMLVTIDDSGIKPSIPSLIDSLRLLSQTTARWRTLDIHASWSISASFAGCTFERLTHLVWTYSGSNQEIDFSTASLLSRLKVFGMSQLIVKWDRIRDYSCSSCGFQYLRRLTEVERLTLDLTHNAGPALTVPVSTPSVLALSMTEDRSTRISINEMSKLLDFPALNTLEIVSQGHELPAFPGRLPHLRNLGLVTLGYPEDISAFLAMHDSIESLHTSSHGVLRALVVTPGDPVILPSLTSLSVDAETMRRNGNIFFEAIESRSTGPAGVARLVELVIVGTEKQREWAKRVVSEQPKLLERWTAFCGQVTIIERDERVWYTRK